MDWPRYSKMLKSGPINNYKGSRPTCLYARLESSRISDSSVSAETVIYEAFVLMGEIGWWFSALLSWRKGKVKRSLEG